MKFVNVSLGRIVVEVSKGIPGDICEEIFENFLRQKNPRTLKIIHEQKFNKRPSDS